MKSLMTHGLRVNSLKLISRNASRNFNRSKTIQMRVSLKMTYLLRIKVPTMKKKAKLRKRRKKRKLKLRTKSKRRKML